MTFRAGCEERERPGKRNECNARLFSAPTNIHCTPAPAACPAVVAAAPPSLRSPRSRDELRSLLRLLRSPLRLRLRLLRLLSRERDLSLSRLSWSLSLSRLS